MKTYTIEVEVDDAFAPGLQRLTDAVADLLEGDGARECNYTVVTRGPPEMRIGWVWR